MRPEHIFRDSFSDMILFSYSTEHMLKKDKIRFFYALNGRDGKSGILEKYNAEHFGVTVLLVPVKSGKAFQDFFRLWGVPFKRIEMLVEA